MPNVALVPAHATRIPTLEGYIDGFPDELHKLVTDTGKSPLEDGSIITDHAVARAEQLELTGITSDLTIEGVAHPRAAMEHLRALHRAVTALTVVTPFGTYRDMLITEIKAQRAGNGLRFTMKLEHLLRVGVRDEEVGPDVGGPAEGRTSEVQRGAVPAVPAPPASLPDIESGLAQAIPRTPTAVSAMAFHGVPELPAVTTKYLTEAQRPGSVLRPTPTILQRGQSVRGLLQRPSQLLYQAAGLAQSQIARRTGGAVSPAALQLPGLRTVRSLTARTVGRLVPLLDASTVLDRQFGRLP